MSDTGVHWFRSIFYLCLSATSWGAGPGNLDNKLNFWLFGKLSRWQCTNGLKATVSLPQKHSSWKTAGKEITTRFFLICIYSHLKLFVQRISPRRGSDFGLESASGKKAQSERCLVGSC